jgi:hypothetical protein
MTMNDIIREGQDKLVRIHLCRIRQRVHDTIRSWAETPVQPGPSIGELCLEMTGSEITQIAKEMELIGPSLEEMCLYGCCLIRHFKANDLRRAMYHRRST